jgi:hypothetical protein
MMHASRIDPTISMYEVLHRPYEWNRYPLTPLGCKTVVYEDRDTRGSWALRGVDGWYLGPSMDHYHCDIYYIPETRAYQISGSTEIFPQHCKLSGMTPHQHLRALTDALTDGADTHSQASFTAFAGQNHHNACRHLLWRNKGWQITISFCNKRQNKGRLTTLLF